VKKSTSLMQGWILPTVTSFTAGFIVFVLFSVFLGVIGQPQIYGLLAGLVVWVLAFWDLVNRYGGHMMRVMTLQVTPPPVIMPEQKAQRVSNTPQTRLEIIRHDENGDVVEGEFVDFFEDRDQIRLFAQYTVGPYQRHLSSRELVGPGRPFKKPDDFETFWDGLVKHGLAEWKKPGYPQQGRRLTQLGERVMKGQIKPNPPLLDRARDVQDDG